MASSRGCTVGLLFCTLAAITCSRASAVSPGDVAPGPFEADVLEDAVYTWTPGRHALVFMYKAADPFNRFMMSNAWSLETFLHLAPYEGVDFLFVPDTTDARAAEVQAKRWYSRVVMAMRSAGLTEAEQEARLRQLYFVTSAGLPRSPWVAALQAEWSSEQKIIRASGYGGEGWWNETIARLDSWYAWLPWPAPGQSGPLVHVPRLCFVLPPASQQQVAGKWVLVPNSSACRAEDMIRNAQAARAAGVIMYAERHTEVDLIRSVDQDMDVVGAGGGKDEAPTTQQQRTALGRSHHGHKHHDYDDYDDDYDYDDNNNRRHRNHLSHGPDGPSHMEGPAVFEAQRRRRRSLLLADQRPPFSTPPSSAAGNDANDDELRTPAVSISWEDGFVLREMLEVFGAGGVNVEFDVKQVPGSFFGIDAEGRLFELGWAKIPTLMHMAWQAQYQLYLGNLQRQLKQPVDTDITVFQDATIAGEHGSYVEVDMPHASHMRKFSKAELDMRLNCPGHTDADCPAWDHVVQMFACCGDVAKCVSCPSTPWAQSVNTTMYLAAGKGAATQPCGHEVGRWITPFRRRVGRWLTDISPLLPLLRPFGNTKCVFTVQTAPWAGGWRASVNLRLSTATKPSPHIFSNTNDGTLGPTRKWPKFAQLGSQAFGYTNAASQDHVIPPFGRGAVRHAAGKSLQVARKHADKTIVRVGHSENLDLVPLVAIPLFKGGAFDTSYNNRTSLRIKTPKFASGMAIFATISGHGSDANNCAEFCPTAHAFEVNGVSSVIEFINAGTSWGCTHETVNGGVPNEHGTWFYGRNGWCDGQQVKPWVADFTDQMATQETTNDIVYKGIFDGGALPQPEEHNAGYIMMSSFVVFYGPRSS